jgi:hypothetical protein
MLNRKGHLGTMLMVFGALVLVGAATYGFSTFSNKSDKIENEIKLIISEYNFYESYVRKSFNLMVKLSIDEAKKENKEFKLAFCEKIKEKAREKRDEWKERTNLFGKVEEENCELVDIGSGKYKYLVEDVFVWRKVGENEIRNVFDLSSEFDK